MSNEKAKLDDKVLENYYNKRRGQEALEFIKVYACFNEIWQDKNKDKMEESIQVIQKLIDSL